MVVDSKELISNSDFVKFYSASFIQSGTIKSTGDASNFNLYIDGLTASSGGLKYKSGIKCKSTMNLYKWTKS